MNTAWRQDQYFLEKRSLTPWDNRSDILCCLTQLFCTLCTSRTLQRKRWTSSRTKPGTIAAREHKVKDISDPYTWSSTTFQATRWPVLDDYVLHTSTLTVKVHYTIPSIRCKIPASAVWAATPQKTHKTASKASLPVMLALTVIRFEITSWNCPLA